MLFNLSFTFERPIICKTVKYIDLLDHRGAFNIVAATLKNPIERKASLAAT